jgi:DDE superfamily endonuclease
VLDLYDRTWHGQRLGGDEYVLSADEKSQLPALHRRHPDLPPAPDRMRRTEFEYRRGGTLAYLAAYDVHAARVLGRAAPTTGIAPFDELVEQVMTTEPYAGAARVFWIVDNGASHNGARSIARMRAAWPTAELVHLPIHASWLNQVEIFIPIVQQGDQARGLHRPHPAGPAATGVPGPLQRHRRALRLALHPQSPRSPARPARRPRTAGRMTPDVSTEMSISSSGIRPRDRWPADPPPVGGIPAGQRPPCSPEQGRCGNRPQSPGRHPIIVRRPVHRRPETSAQS